MRPDLDYVPVVVGEVDVDVAVRTRCPNMDVAPGHGRVQRLGLKQHDLARQFGLGRRLADDLVERKTRPTAKVFALNRPRFLVPVADDIGKCRPVGVWNGSNRSVVCVATSTIAGNVGDFTRPHLRWACPPASSLAVREGMPPDHRRARWCAARTYARRDLQPLSLRRQLSVQGHMHNKRRRSLVPDENAASSHLQRFG